MEKITRKNIENDFKSIRTCCKIKRTDCKIKRTDYGCDIVERSSYESSSYELIYINHDSKIIILK